MLESVFTAIDIDQGGTVSFKELAAGISFFVAGDVADTTTAIYSLYGGEEMHLSDLKSYIVSMLSMAFQANAELMQVRERSNIYV